MKPKFLLLSQDDIIEATDQWYHAATDTWVEAVIIDDEFDEEPFVGKLWDFDYPPFRRAL